MVAPLPGLAFTADSPYFQRELAGAEEGIHDLNAYMGDLTKQAKSYIKNLNANVKCAVELAERMKVARCSHAAPCHAMSRHVTPHHSTPRPPRQTNGHFFACLLSCHRFRICYARHTRPLHCHCLSPTPPTARGHREPANFGRE